MTTVGGLFRGPRGAVVLLTGPEVVALRAAAREAYRARKARGGGYSDGRDTTDGHIDGMRATAATDLARYDARGDELRRLLAEFEADDGVEPPDSQRFVVDGELGWRVHSDICRKAEDASGKSLPNPFTTDPVEAADRARDYRELSGKKTLAQIRAKRALPDGVSPSGSPAGGFVSLAQIRGTRGYLRAPDRTKYWRDENAAGAAYARFTSEATTMKEKKAMLCSKKEAKKKPEWF